MWGGRGGRGKGEEGERRERERGGREEGRRDEGRQRSWEGDYVSRIPDNTMKGMALF